MAERDFNEICWAMQRTVQSDLLLVQDRSKIGKRRLHPPRDIKGVRPVLARQRQQDPRLSLDECITKFWSRCLLDFRHIT